MRPEKGDFRLWAVSNRHVLRSAPASEIVELAEKAMRVLPEVPMYARVDIMYDDHTQRYLVSELELLDPCLFLLSHPGAVTTYAEEILLRLRS